MVQREIIAFLAANRGKKFYPRDIAKGAGQRLNRVSYGLKGLRKTNMIRYEGEFRRIYWME